LTAVYMRPLGGGHLYRLNGSTYFSSGSEVREIKCTWADNTWEQQIRLLGG
jgi:hypothetical protein